MEAATTQASIWAARVIARYAQSAEPELSSKEVAELYKTLIAGLRPAMRKGGASDWISALNSALDSWEEGRHTLGPRVDDLDLIGERVGMSDERVIMRLLGKQ